MINGIFYKGELKGNNLKIFTIDNYGNGELVVVFDDSFNEFSGTWTEDNKRRDSNGMEKSANFVMNKSVCSFYLNLL